MKLIDPKRDTVFFAAVACTIAILYFMVAGPVFFRPTQLAVEKGTAADPAILLSHVSYLSSLRPTRVFPNSQLGEGAKYITEYFQKYCHEVRVETYTVASSSAENIICSFNTDKKERVIVGAHYDTFGNTPGADDNASGVAGMLELARLIANKSEQFKYRIDLAAFTLEEPPFFRTDDMGSYRYAAQLKKENVPVKLMISFETIGYYSDKKDSQKFPHWLLKAMYPNTGNYALIVGNIRNSLVSRSFKKDFMRGTDMDVLSLNGPIDLFGIDFSDHRSFWKVGYPAIMVTDTAMNRNPNYHKTTDTPDTLNYGKIAKVVEGVYNAIRNL